MLYNGNFDFGKSVRITLPTIYATALSYYEVIAMLANRVEECFRTVEEYGETYKDYTDNAIANLQQNVDEQLASTVAELTVQYSNFTNLVDDHLTVMNNRIDEFNDRLTDEIIGVNARTDLAIEQNNEYILEEIGKGFVNLKVINYFTGEIVTVQEMFDYLSAFHLSNAISYTSLAGKEKTYTELARLSITYTQLATNGNALIV